MNQSNEAYCDNNQKTKKETNNNTLLVCTQASGPHLSLDRRKGWTGFK